MAEEVQRRPRGGARGPARVLRRPRRGRRGAARRAAARLGAVPASELVARSLREPAHVRVGRDRGARRDARRRRGSRGAGGQRWSAAAASTGSGSTARRCSRSATAAGGSSTSRCSGRRRLESIVFGPLAEQEQRRRDGARARRRPVVVGDAVRGRARQRGRRRGEARSGVRAVRDRDGVGAARARPERSPSRRARRQRSCSSPAPPSSSSTRCSRSRSALRAGRRKLRFLLKVPLAKPERARAAAPAARCCRCFRSSWPRRLGSGRRHHRRGVVVVGLARDPGPVLHRALGLHADARDGLLPKRLDPSATGSTRSSRSARSCCCG